MFSICVISEFRNVKKCRLQTIFYKENKPITFKILQFNLKYMYCQKIKGQFTYLGNLNGKLNSALLIVFILPFKDNCSGPIKN